MSGAIPFPGREYNLRHRGDELPFHPLASIFPLLEGSDLVSLKDDIAANGLMEPIVVLDGLILDGRNRFLACHAVAAERGWPDSGFEPPVRFVQYNGMDPLNFVLSLNLRRRHLDESQRSMVAAKLANIRNGLHKNASSANLRVSQADAARALNVSERSVTSAASVLELAIPQLQKAVETGHIAVSTAAVLATRPKTVQKQAVSDPSRAIHLAKKEKRTEREAELGEKQQALPDRRYGVIVADPEWRFEPWSRTTGMDRAADNHYPTSVTEVIAAREVPSISADDCALFLWATAPMLPQALLVMEAWGFDYRSHFVWAKDRQGTGYWSRNKHELLLIGVRGQVPAPAPGTQWPSLIEAVVGEHSAKPERFLEMIEEYFPSLPKIELNRRGSARPGWDAWGNEAVQAEAAE